MFKPTTKILVVDDMLTMRKIVKNSLVGMGYSVIEEAEDGAKAWERLNACGDIGLIISDWNMPNLTGLEFLKKVRADAKFKVLPFILLTAEGESNQVLEAVSAGVDCYVMKPFTADSLKQKLEQAFKKRPQT